jgi:hypothetical protein
MSVAVDRRIFFTICGVGLTAYSAKYASMMIAATPAATGQERLVPCHQ